MVGSQGVADERQGGELVVAAAEVGGDQGLGAFITDSPGMRWERWQWAFIRLSRAFSACNVAPSVRCLASRWYGIARSLCPASISTLGKQG